jgi:UPF0755 protein
MSQDFQDVPPGENQPGEPAPQKPQRRGWFGRRRQPPAPEAPVSSDPKETKRLARQRRWSERSKSPFIVAGNTLITLIIVVALLIAGAVRVFENRFEKPGPSTAETTMIVPRGAGAREVAQDLQSQGLIDGEWTFVVGIQATGNRGKLQAGEYTIPAHASMRAIMDMLVSGKVTEHSITIPEGLTSQQIVARIEADPLLKGDVNEVPPEGTLLPETYRYIRGTTRQQMLERMQGAQERVLSDIWANRIPGLPIESPEKLVTLASIVEKETGVAAERPRVAAVFINRLKKHMRLQSDPTIIYGLVGGKGTLGRPILRSEISKATPYNPYVIPGLPPGPIANPGRASMEAVAQPAETKDLYFVADGSGGHAFASSLSEHQRNVANWRRIQREKPEAETDHAPADAKDEAAGGGN